MADRAALREEYINRINRVMDYIEEHLDDDLNLETLARVANFSPYHFHRIFGAMTGETLFSFIARLRIEKAAGHLVKFPRRSVTRVALDCGFSNSAAFSRAFRDRYGMTPSAWRGGASVQKSNTGMNESNTGTAPGKEWKESAVPPVYPDVIMTTGGWRMRMKDGTQVTVTVKEIPEFTVVYVRHVGPYQGDAALFRGLYARLCRWAAPRGYLNDPDARFIAVYHDDPAVTDSSRLRTSMCLTVPGGTRADGEVGVMTLGGGTYAVGHFEIATDRFGEAWDLMCGAWLPGSGYQPDDKLSYEVNLNDPEDHPEGKHIVDICIPVRPM